MAEDTIVKHAYHGKKLKFSTSNKEHKIVLNKPRNVEIVSATASGVADKNLKVFVKSDNNALGPFYKEEELELTPLTELPRNKKITIVIPQSDDQPVFNLFPQGQTANQIYQIPLQGFIAAENTDPIKIFLFNFNPPSGAYPPVLKMSGDASYLNGIGFTPVTDDDSTLLFSQEMSSPLNIPDGPVNIDELTKENTQSIVKEILGQDYEQHLDKEKVEKGEEKPFWTKEYSIKAGVEIHELIEHHILKDFGFKGKFFVKTTKGKQYVIFKGFAGMRKWYSGTRYAATNPKVFNFTASGKLKSGMKGNAVTMLIVGSVDIVSWMMNDDKDKQFSDLCVELGMDSLKVVVGSLITAGITAAVLAGLAALALTAPVWLVVGGAILIGIAVGFALDFIDQKTGASEYMKTKGQEGQSLLEEAWKEHVEEPFGRLYYQLEKSIENLYLNPAGPGW